MWRYIANEQMDVHFKTDGLIHCIEEPKFGLLTHSEMGVEMQRLQNIKRRQLSEVQGAGKRQTIYEKQSGLRKNE